MLTYNGPPALWVLSITPAPPGMLIPVLIPCAHSLLIPCALRSLPLLPQGSPVHCCPCHCGPLVALLLRCAFPVLLPPAGGRHSRRVVPQSPKLLFHSPLCTRLLGWGRPTFLLTPTWHPTRGRGSAPDPQHPHRGVVFSPQTQTLNFLPFLCSSPGDCPRKCGPLSFQSHSFKAGSPLTPLSLPPCAKSAIPPEGTPQSRAKLQSWAVKTFHGVVLPLVCQCFNPVCLSMGSNPARLVASRSMILLLRSDICAFVCPGIPSLDMWIIIQ